jgi:hypothetical protein
MAYTLDFSINLGASQTGLTLKAQLVNTSGADVGSEISAGFTEIGFGQYLAHLTAIPDGHRGGVKFYTGTLPTGLKAFAAINPEEAENSDIKTSEVESGGGGGDSLQRTAAIRVSDQQADSDDIYLTIGDSYSTDNGRALHFLDVKSLWPDLDAGEVNFYVQDSVIQAEVVEDTGNNKEVKVELSSTDTAELVVGKMRYSLRHVLDGTPDEIETLAQGRVIVKANP